MSIDHRLNQDAAKAELDKKLGIRRTLVILEKKLLLAGPYDKIEILSKQNGRGFTIRTTKLDQEEIDFGDSRDPKTSILP